MKDSLTSTQTVYSADVRIELIVADKSFELAQVGPEYASVRNPIDMRPCNGEIVVYVDGRPCRRGVRLVAGMSSNSNDLVLGTVDLPSA